MWVICIRWWEKVQEEAFMKESVQYSSDGMWALQLHPIPQDNQ